MGPGTAGGEVVSGADDDRYIGKGFVAGNFRTDKKHTAGAVRF